MCRHSIFSIYNTCILERISILFVHMILYQLHPFDTEQVANELDMMRQSDLSLAVSSPASIRRFRSFRLSCQHETPLFSQLFGPSKARSITSSGRFESIQGLER